MESEPGRRSILIVDDELSWLGFARSLLTEEGYTVQTTQSVSSSWALIQDKRFELILADLTKVRQEEEFFQKLAGRQTKRGCRTVVMFPTELTPENARIMFKLGAQDCIDKRYDKPGLLKLVSEQLAQIPLTTASGLPTILIIEDDADWRKRLVRYLDAALYQIETADDSVSAAELLKRGSLDVVVLDLRLDEDSDDFQGFELLRSLKETNKEAAVIIVSAYGTLEHIRNGFNVYNIYDYLSKQYFDPAQYREVVRKAIQQRHPS